MKVAKTIEEIIERTKPFIGKSFPYYSRYEYPHGRMKEAKLIGVQENRPDRVPAAYLEITFTDGFKAEYTTGLPALYEHIIINMED